MPEIPNYQSRGVGPGESGLGQINPGVVGGTPIVQGLSNVAQGMLVYAAHQERQAQVDQISEAGRIFGTISEQMDQKAQDLRNRQAETPVNPRLVGQEFRAFSQKLVNDTLASPSIASVPSLSKYLATHLPQALHSRMQAFDTYANDTWRQWDQFETGLALQGMRESAVRDPAQEPEMMKHAQALLRGKTMMGSLTGEQAGTAWTDFEHSVTYGRGLLFAKSHASSWVDAGHRGQFPEGFDASRYNAAELKEYDVVARETFSTITAQAKDDEVLHRREIEDSYQKEKNVWLSRHLVHQDASGARQRADSVDRILSDLGTNKARATLGNEWDSVHSFYVALDQHLRAAGGVKPSPGKYNQVLEGIYTGRLTTTMSVLKEAAGLHFDIPSTNEVLGKFETERGHLDQATQQRVMQSIEVIRGRFALAPGQTIDAAGKQEYMTTVLTRHFLWLEGLRAKGGTALADADLVGTAQKISDQAYLSMQQNVITIIPQTEASLLYKNENEVKAALTSGKITEREAMSRLQEIDTLRQLQHITGSQTPKLGHGREEPFK